MSILDKLEIIFCKPPVSDHWLGHWYIGVPGTNLVIQHKTKKKETLIFVEDIFGHGEVNAQAKLDEMRNK